MWRNKRFRLAALIAVALLIGAGVLIYADWFGFDEPAARAASAPTLAAEVQQRVYRIDPARSIVRYTVEEFFVGQGGSTAVGTTNAIAGDIVIDPTDYASSQVGTIVIGIEQFTSDSGLRDRRIRREYLESSAYPEAVFVPHDLTDFPAVITEGEEAAFSMTGDLTVKATTAPVTWDVAATLSGEMLTGTATTTLLMSDYGVGPIDIAGLLETSDEVLLEFEFVAPLVSSEAAATATAETTATP
jgi:polyisoprenoid-binding protein YceI